MFDEHALRRVRLLASMYLEAGRRDGRDDDEIRRALMAFGEGVAAGGDLDPWSEEVLIAELGRVIDGTPSDTQCPDHMIGIETPESYTLTPEP